MVEKEKQRLRERIREEESGWWNNIHQEDMDRNKYKKLQVIIGLGVKENLQHLVNLVI